MDAVVFDLFGTLVPNFPPAKWHACNVAIADRLGAVPDDFVAAWGETYRDRMEGKLADTDRVFEGTAAKLGLSVDDETLLAAANIRREFLLTALTPKPDAIACLDALRGHGFRLALATDCTSETPGLLDRTPLGAYFEIRAVSAFLGTRKPHESMYLHVLDGLGLKGDRCFYVGDGNSEELPGAKRHGMTTIWVDNGDRQHHEDRFVPGGDYAVRKLGELPALLQSIM